MKLLHSSDLHGGYKPLLAVTEPFDIWLDTGDFFPTAGRDKSFKQGLGYRIAAHIERPYQEQWANHKKLGTRLVEWLNGRTLVSVQGNHDFISLATLVKSCGGKAYSITASTPADVRGWTFAGFPEIPYIGGEWSNEVDPITHPTKFRELTAQVLSQGPELLVTHAPPHRILDDKEGYGISELYQGLMYQTHEVEHHFFGHCHESGGQTITKHDIKFYNGAQAIVIHVIHP